MKQLVSLYDILRILDPKQDIRIYIGDGEWLGMNAGVANKIMSIRQLSRLVFRLEVNDDKELAIYLEQK